MGVDVGHHRGLVEAGERTEVDRLGFMVATTPQATAMVAGAAAGGLAITLTVGPAEYLQWLGDMTSMLVHEQWRKEVRCTQGF